MLSEVSGEEADLPECAAGVPGSVGVSISEYTT